MRGDRRCAATWLATARRAAGLLLLSAACRPPATPTPAAPTPAPPTVPPPAEPARPAAPPPREASPSDDDGLPADARAAGVRFCAAGRLALGAEEAALLALHARDRAARGLPPLCVHPALVRAARAHAADMLARDYYDHRTPEGLGWVQRAERAGYRDWQRLSENLFWGVVGEFGTPGRAFEGWVASDYHRANLRREIAREIGVGSVAGGPFQGVRRARVYVALYGRRVERVAPRAGGE